MNYNIVSISEEFLASMQAAGIAYSGEIVPDGKLHRFHIEGHRRGSTNGAYSLRIDGRPVGFFQDWKSGISQSWRHGGGCQPFSYALIKQIADVKQQREAETRQKHKAAQLKAVEIWSRSKPIGQQSEHGYLLDKGIQPHGARLYHDALVIPIHNESDQLVNLQFINPKGEKRFLSGGQKRGCFHIIGSLTKRILICEGFATAASLFENSGQRTVIAFDAGNLPPVAKNIRELAPPDTEIIICGDNDFSNVGQTKAREAALATGGKLLIPAVPGTDWNDRLTVGGRNA